MFFLQEVEELEERVRDLLHDHGNKKSIYEEKLQNHEHEIHQFKQNVGELNDVETRILSYKERIQEAHAALQQLAERTKQQQVHQFTSAPFPPIFLAKPCHIGPIFKSTLTSQHCLGNT